MIDSIGAMNGLLNFNGPDPAAMRRHQGHAFKKADESQDGTLDQTEFLTFATNLSERTGKDIDGSKLFASLDSNQDSLIDKREFKAGMEKLRPHGPGGPGGPGGPKKGGGPGADFNQMLETLLENDEDEAAKLLTETYSSGSFALNNPLLNSYTNTSSILDDGDSSLNFLA